MKRFDYLKADSPEAATSHAALTGGKFIAGGTNLLDLMKLRIETPATLVDISRLDLTRIEQRDDGGLIIGALATNSDVAANRDVIRDYPMLSRAILAGASGQLRNKATVGGNLLQRTRCYYFYQPALPCNKRIPGSGCAARAGSNRNAAILGTSVHCISAHSSDMAVAMRALEATIVTLRADGNIRRIPLANFYRLPGDTPDVETVLESDELVTHVELPPSRPGKQIYRKVRDRASFAFALVSIAGLVEIEDSYIKSAALAFGGLAPLPWRDVLVEDALVGHAPSAGTFSNAATALLRKAKGSGSNDFKISLARRMLIATLHDLCEQHRAFDVSVTDLAASLGEVGRPAAVSARCARKLIR